jgi:O-antigen ligase
MRGDTLEIERYFRKIFHILLLLTVFACPLVFFSGASDPFWVVEKFFFKFAVSGTAFFYLLMCAKKGSLALPRTPYDLPLLLFFILSIAGAFFVPNPHMFWDKVYLNACYILLMYFIVTASFDDDGYYIPSKLIALVITASVVAAVYGIMQSAGMDFISWGTTFQRRAASTLGNPNFLAGHMILVIPLMYAAIPAARKKSRAILLVSASLAATMAMFLSQTRGAYIAYFVSLAVFVPVMMKTAGASLAGHKKTAAVFGVALVMLIGGYFIGNPKVIERIKAGFEMTDEAGTIRITLWKNTMHLIGDRFFAGTGAGNFPVIYPFYQAAAMHPDQFATADYYKSEHAHNDYLQLIAEYGAPAAGAFFIFIAAVFFTCARGLRNAEKEEKFIAAGITAGIAAMLAHAVFNFPLLIVPTAAVFFTLAAIAAVYSGRSGLSSMAFPYARIIFTAVSAVFVLMAANSTVPLIGNSYLRYGKEAEFISKPDLAYAYAKEAVRAAPDEAENNLFAGSAAEKAGFNAEAPYYFVHAYRLNRGDWDSAMRTFEFYILKNMWKEAMEPATDLYLVSPYSPRAITAMGYSFYINGRHSEAVEIYKRGLEYWPENGDMLYQLSATYGVLGDNADALAYALKAVAVPGAQPGAFYNLAVAYAKSGMKKQARDAANDMLKRFPEEGQRVRDFLKAVK